MPYAIETSDEFASDDIYEFLGVRVIVFSDPISGRDCRHTHEPGCRTYRLWGEQDANISPASFVGAYCVETGDSCCRCRHNASSQLPRVTAARSLVRLGCAVNGGSPLPSPSIWALSRSIHATTSFD